MTKMSSNKRPKLNIKNEGKNKRTRSTRREKPGPSKEPEPIGLNASAKLAYLHDPDCKETEKCLQKLRYKLLAHDGCPVQYFSSILSIIKVKHLKCLQVMMENKPNFFKVTPDQCILGYVSTVQDITIFLGSFDVSQIRNDKAFILRSTRDKCIQIYKYLHEYGYEFQRNVNNVIECPEVLVQAAETGYADVVECLLQIGVYPEPVKINKSGKVFLLPSRTPMSVALNRRHMSIIKALLLHGAQLRPFIQTSTGNFVEVPILIFLLNSYISTVYTESVTPFRDILQLCVEYGVNLWETSSEDVLGTPWGLSTICKAGLNALQYLQGTPKIKEVLPNDTEQLLQTYMSQSPSLQQVCRRSIIHTMKNNYLRNMDSLPLPEDIKKYLKFEKMPIDSDGVGNAERFTVHDRLYLSPESAPMVFE